MNTTPPRYTERAFPPYRFVPGKSPHPTRDPAGHSYHEHPEPLATFDTAQWQNCQEYLYGIDLFNQGYWWEAHEALEALWVAAGRETETGQFLQGLILIAVAHLKMFQGFDDVARRMAGEGLDMVKRVNGIYLGIDVAALHSAVTAYFAGTRQTAVTIDLIIRR